MSNKFYNRIKIIILFNTKRRYGWLFTLASGCSGPAPLPNKKARRVGQALGFIGRG